MVLDSIQKQNIIEKYKLNFTVVKISECLGISKSTIQRIITKYKNCESLDRKKGLG